MSRVLGPKSVQRRTIVNSERSLSRPDHGRRDHRGSRCLHVRENQKGLNMAPRFIARQLARPQGFPGRVIGRLMNWHNAEMNAFAVRRLELEATDHVLEIGFGGGLNLPALI